MSHWDSEQRKIVRWPSQRFPEYPGWVRKDCGCCAGIEWGGDYPRECDRCKEGGYLWLHEASGRLALWPGGPFAGRMAALEGALQ